MAPAGPVKVEVGRLTLHLPTGAVTINGFIRAVDGSPAIGGPVGRPDALIADGGSITLREGDTNPPAKAYRTRTGPVTVGVALALAAALDWFPITREQAVEALRTLGYRLRADRTGPDGARSPLIATERDSTLWHYTRDADGVPDLVSGHVFVMCEVLL